MAAVAADDTAEAPGGGGLIGASPRAILAFAAKAIAWSVPLFALWYLAAQPLSLAASWGAARLLDFAAPVERTAVEWRDDRVKFLVSPDASTVYAKHLRPGLSFEISVNPRKQTYGLPFFLALLLAARARRIAAKAAIGCAVLFVLASGGIACEVAIAYAGLRLPDGASLFTPGTVSATLIALGFQLGSILLPSAGPIALWAGLDGMRGT